MAQKFVERGIVAAIDRAAEVQAPLVRRYTEFVRGRHPGESPEQLRRRLERHYLLAVTASGVGVGLSAAVPGVGTVVGLAAAGADTLFFLEASTVFVAGAAEVGPRAAGRAALPRVSSVILGGAGAEALGAGRKSAAQWDTALANRLPVISSMSDGPVKKFVVQFLVKRVALGFGKVVPAGIGAVVGGAGNHALGREVIGNLHRATSGGRAAATPAAERPAAVGD